MERLASRIDHKGRGFLSMERTKAFHVGTCPFEGDAFTYDIDDLGSIFYTLDRIFLLERGRSS
jgi:hypothetical protein